MENRLCTTFDTKYIDLEKTMDIKVEKAKDIEDERFKRIDEGHREHESRLDRIDQTSFRDYSHNRGRRIDDEHHWQKSDEEEDDII